MTREHPAFRTLLLLTALLAFPAAAAFQPAPPEGPAADDAPVGGEVVLLVEREVQVVREGLAEQGPWLPLHGGTMLGDIEMRAHTLWFGGGGVRVASGDVNLLLFDEVPLCTASATTPGCASAGDIEAVRAGPGLKGGGESGAVLLETDFAFVQRLVTGVCAPGFAIRAISGAGGVTCEEDTDTLGGLGCADGQVAKRLSGAWACGADQDTTYSAGAGLDLGGKTFRVMDCAADEVLKASGPGSWTCARDEVGAGDITAVTAGTGLLGGGNGGDITLTADTSYLQRRVTGSCAAGSAMRSIAQDGTTLTCETDDDTTYTAGDGLRLSGTTFAVLDCAADQVLKGNSTGAWACGRDEDTTYTAGTCLNLAGTAFSADTTCVQRRVTGTCAAGSAMRSIAQDGTTLTCEADDDALGGLACADDQIAKRRSGAWACASDANSGGTVTSVASGAGLTGGPITGSGTLSVGPGGIVDDMLAADSVDASKTKDEPAAKASAASATIRVGSANTTLATVNVTFPADGFALVHSQATWENNPSSTETGNLINVSLLEGTTLLDGWRWDAGDDDGRIDLGQSHVSLLSVTAGAHSYTLKARTSSGTADAEHGEFVVVWVASGL